MKYLLIAAAFWAPLASASFDREIVCVKNKHTNSPTVIVIKAPLCPVGWREEI